MRTELVEDMWIFHTAINNKITDHKVMKIANMRSATKGYDR